MLGAVGQWRVTRELREVLDAARTHSVEAIERLAFWMRADDPKASPAACIALLNRAWGAPTQPMDVTQRVTLEDLVCAAQEALAMERN